MARRQQSEIRASEERRSYGLDRGDARCVAWWGGWELTGADKAETLFRPATDVKNGVA